MQLRPKILLTISVTCPAKGRFTKCRILLGSKYLWNVETEASPLVHNALSSNIPINTRVLNGSNLWACSCLRNPTPLKIARWEAKGRTNSKMTEGLRNFRPRSRVESRRERESRREPTILCKEVDRKNALLRAPYKDMQKILSGILVESRQELPTAALLAKTRKQILYPLFFA